MFVEHACPHCLFYVQTTTRTRAICPNCGTFADAYGPDDASDAALSLARHKAKHPDTLTPTPAPTERELTIDQAHKRTGIPKRTLRDRCKSGALPATKRGDVRNARSRWRIPESALPQPAANLD